MGGMEHERKQKIENRELRTENRKQKASIWVWWVLIVGFVLFSFAPNIYELSRMHDLQPNRQFELVHNFYTDYNFYLSRIRQGLEGRGTVVERYTTEPHAGSFVHWLYLGMGQAGRFVRVPQHRAGDVYHMARVVLGVALLVMTAAFCMRGPWGSTSHWKAMAFLLAVTAASWPKLVAVAENQVVPATLENIAGWRLGGYMPWWSVMDSLQRITFIPHLLAGQTLMLVLVLLLTNETILKKSIHIVFLGLLAFVLGMIFPPGLIFVYGVFFVFGIIRLVETRKLNRGMWFSWGAVGLISSASLVYLILITSVYPWKRLAELDILHPLPFAYVEYFKAIGPIGPIGFIGLIWAFFKKETPLYPAIAWVIAWLVFLVVFQFIPQQSPLRFSEMIPHVPLGILSVYVFFRLSHLRYLRNFGKLMTWGLIFLGFLQMYSSYLWQRDFVDHKIRATVPLVPTGSYVMYPLQDFIHAMWAVHDLTHGEGVVLSETTAGNYIPVISGNTVYVGHDNTVDAEEKKQNVRAFFSGQMHELTAENFLDAIGARMVFFGPQEREDGGIQDLSFVYPFLTAVYTNPAVTVYAFR